MTRPAQTINPRGLFGITWLPQVVAERPNYPPVQMGVQDPSYELFAVFSMFMGVLPFYGTIPTSPGFSKKSPGIDPLFLLPDSISFPSQPPLPLAVLSTNRTQWRYFFPGGGGRR